jgi:hypothetical protein
MAGNNGSKSKRGKAARQKESRRAHRKRCRACGYDTRWLSVDGMCWDCTVKSVKAKAPIYIESTEEEPESSDVGTASLSE